MTNFNFSVAPLKENSAKLWPEIPMWWPTTSDRCCVMVVLGNLFWWNTRGLKCYTLQWRGVVSAKYHGSQLGRYHTYFVHIQICSLAFLACTASFKALTSFFWILLNIFDNGNRRYRVLEHEFWVHKGFSILQNFMTIGGECKMQCEQVVRWRVIYIVRLEIFYFSFLVCHAL